MINTVSARSKSHPFAFFGWLLVALATVMIFSPALTSVAEAGSTMRVKAASAHGRHISLGLNKSVVIETPRDVRDVLVSNPAIADAVVRNARRVYLIGMKIGQANVVLFDGQGAQIAAFEINVTRDNGSLAALFRRMIPGSNIKVDGVGEGVALSGTVRNPADAEKAMDLAANYVGDRDKVSNYIAVQAREQVQLRVTVAEVERSLIKQLGIDVRGRFSRGAVNLSGVIENPFSASQLQLSQTLLNAAIGTNDRFGGLALKAMERNGLLRTLAEPNLTAVSGEKASFLAGGEFPIPVGLDDGKIAVEFKPFGVALGFRPIVMSENRISLQVKTEVSEITTETAVQLGGGTDDEGRRNFKLTVPGLKVRRSETTLELPSGGTMAMAGLLRDDFRKNIDGFPGLKDVPILGSLFSSTDYKRSQTELVIFITPYIVNPVARAKLAAPTNNVEPASDLNSIFMGQLNRRYNISGGRRGVKYHGRFGYSYD